jgi:uncharacterized protein YjiS (DUF1127 family)
MNNQHSKHRFGDVYDLTGDNPNTVADRLTPEQIEAALRRAHVERARVASALLASVWQGLRAGASALARGIARAQQRRATLLALRYLDAHLLDDIGLGRGQGRALVDGVLSTPPARPQVRLVDASSAPSAPQQRRAA